MIKREKAEIFSLGTGFILILAEITLAAVIHEVVLFFLAQVIVAAPCPVILQHLIGFRYSDKMDRGYRILANIRLQTLDELLPGAVDLGLDGALRHPEYTVITLDHILYR